MVTVELKGGLGNQLFQIFACIAYALRTSQDFRIPIKSLGGFDTYWHNLFFNISNKVEPYTAPRRWLQPYFHYTDIPKQRGIKIVGYFQSYKYFSDYFDEIYNMIDINGKKRELCNEYFDFFEHPCFSMHFRIGDYEKMQHKFPVQTTDYYRRAITRMLEETGMEKPRCIYACQRENRGQVQSMIRELRLDFPQVKFRKIPDTLADWQQMLMMSLCDHNIIANSSFSWWSAYLNTADNVVIYPAVWFGPAKGGRDMSDLTPENWIKA